jgi:hypothetical protein
LTEPSSSAAIRADIGAGARFPEESLFDQRLEERIAHDCVKAPQSLYLILRQMKIRDFEVLGTYQLSPIRNGRPGRNHLCLGCGI